MILFFLLLIWTFMLILLLRIFEVGRYTRWILDVIGINIESYRNCENEEDLAKRSSVTIFLLSELDRVSFNEMTWKFWRDPESFYSKEFLNHINEINK